MNKLSSTLLIALSTFSLANINAAEVSSQSDKLEPLVHSRALYNHGNHNDPTHYFGGGTSLTVNCGYGVSISECTEVGGPILIGAADSKCQSMISWVPPGYAVPYGSSYYHLVRNNGFSITSIYSSGSQWNVDMTLSCRALRHPGKAKKIVM